MESDLPLFTPKHTVRSTLSGPLADRMRPRTLEEFCGQESLLGPGAPLRQSIEEDRVQSFILWGPPGTGKTTLAQVIAHYTSREFIPLSAVMSGIKDIKEAVSRAQHLLRTSGRKTILFIDEIHRFNKAQQDALLPYVENGTVTLIGATTENPSFELNSALLSRAPVYVLKSLTDENLRQILTHALENKERGLGELDHFPNEWLEKIITLANGDARRGLTLLERAGEFLKQNPEKRDIEFLEKALGAKNLRYDATGEEHYNTISAFIKSMRDSDPDAALYYLGRMLHAGEDPLFIARRMVIFASEDIGNADPRALQIAVSVRDAVDFVGMPEARINLAQGVTYLSCAPKSNASYVGVNEAIADVEKYGNLEIPLHIRNAPTKLMKSLGYGKDYKYAHDFNEGTAAMQNLPRELSRKKYYNPKDSGLEKQIAQRLEELRKNRSK